MCVVQAGRQAHLCQKTDKTLTGYQDIKMCTVQAGRGGTPV